MTALRLSVLAVIAAMAIAISPAAADTVVTFNMTLNDSIGGGDFTLDMTTGNFVSASMELGAPGEQLSSVNNVVYFPCGSGPSAITPCDNRAGRLGEDELFFSLSNGDSFVAYTAEILSEFVAGIIQGEGTMNDYFCTATIDPACVEPGNAFGPNQYGGELSIVSKIDTPEPASAFLFIGGLVVLFFAARQLREN